MNYKETLAYLYSFSDFERSGKYNRDPLEKVPREAKLLERIGNPQQRYSSTLIAGTKGKGSTAALLERVLRQAGVRTGLYTQPDLHTFRERMRVNGRIISEEEMVALVPEVGVAVEQMQAEHEFSPFITYEVATALAFLYFERQKVQHAVVEVGLGGRLDATNVLNPLVSVITSISYDHMQILGNTLTQIATEKAGIIKQGGHVVTSAQSPEALLAIATVQQQRQAHLIRVGSADGDPAQVEVDAGRLPPLHYCYRLEQRSEKYQRFTVWTPEQIYTELEIPLAGRHQLENATTALATLTVLHEHGIQWDEAALREGFQEVYWPARMEVVGHEPTIVVDGAHNADSMQKLLQAICSSFSFDRLIFVLGLAQDKDLTGIVQALVGIDVVVLTHMPSPRSASLEELAALFAAYAPHVEVHRIEQGEQAMDFAVNLAAQSDLICATGSLYLAAEVLRWAAAHGDAGAATTIEGVDH